LRGVIRRVMLGRKGGAGVYRECDTLLLSSSRCAIIE
jgi:hypothetical protein